MPIVVSRDDARRRFVAVASERLDIQDIVGLGGYLAGLHRSYAMLLDLRAAMLAFAEPEIERIVTAGVRRQTADGPRGRMAVVADSEHLRAVARVYEAFAKASKLPPVGVFDTPEAAHAWLDEVAFT